MTKSERYEYILNYFKNQLPEPQTELNYNNPFELLVSVVLSAQCTDKRVNIVTEKLFQLYNTPQQFSELTFDELFPFIKSISYPNNKTKHLLALSKMLVNEYNGEIPQNIETLQKLPGVGRKTANVIVSVLYHQPAMAVDTHVFRVSKRLGLVIEKSKTPLEVENQLVKHIPKELIHKAHHWLILHGRYVCVARNPQCEKCNFKHICKFYSKLQKR